MLIRCNVWRSARNRAIYCYQFCGITSDKSNRTPVKRKLIKYLKIWQIYQKIVHCNIIFNLNLILLDKDISLFLKSMSKNIYNFDIFIKIFFIALKNQIIYIVIVSSSD